MNASAVYWIRHKDHTDMFTQGYVGVSVDHRQRWNRHRREAQNKHLWNAIKKYGWENLEKEIVLYAKEDYCLTIEKKLRPVNNVGWNITIGGGKPPPGYGNKNALGRAPKNKGIPLTAEQKAHLSKVMTGRPGYWKGISMSEETKLKVSIAKKGSVPPNKGKKASAETRLKQRLAKLGKPGNRLGFKCTPETIEKIRNRVLPPITEETKLKISQANLGRKHQRVTCPHCGKKGGITAMPRWHFDNCKMKEQ